FISRDIVIGILGILFRKSVYQVMQSYEAYIVSFALAAILTIILEFKFNKICDLNMSRKLLISRNKLKIMTLTITSLVIILINTNYTYYYTSDIINITYLLLINRICIAFCFCFALNTGIKYVTWIEEEVMYKTNILNLQYNYEMKKKVDEYSKLLRMYNHDFKNILLNIKDSIEIGDNEKAKKIIDEFDEKIKDITNYNKTLSNNSLINALLNRVNDKCNSENIFFDSDCYIPNKLIISELELIKIFNNLSSNAIEACIKQKNDEKRWISFKSYVRDNYLIIYQSNSFNGHIKFRNDKLITTKKNIDQN
uniref:GHKL domain-containing protein n=1 Tax=Clostridium tertium TaxID=1559 RepID=UPI00374E313E